MLASSSQQQRRRDDGEEGVVHQALVEPLLPVPNGDGDNERMDVDEQPAERQVSTENQATPSSSSQGDGNGNDDDEIAAPDTSNNNNQHDKTAAAGLLFYRGLYFLNGLSASTWGRFGIIYYNAVCHLSPEQIGLLQGVMPLVSFVAMPVWGAVSDYCHSRKRVFLVCKLLSTLSLLSLWRCGSSNNNNNNNSDDDESKHSLFHSILLSVTGMALFRSSGILDAFCLDFLSEHCAVAGGRSLYGSVRLWTAVSWGLGAIVMGIISDEFGFASNFLLYGGMMSIMLLVVAFGLPAQSKAEQARYNAAVQAAAEAAAQGDDDAAAAAVAASRPRFAVLIKALCRFQVLFWLAQVIVIGSGMALVDSFLFVFLQNDLHASTQLCGWTVGVTVLCELPIFHYSAWLLQHVGHDGLFVVSMAAYAIRVFGYTYLTVHTVHWVLALEVLHGITFACMWIASIDFSAAIAPAEWSTTVQTILSAAFTCFGSVVGSLVGGWVMQTQGATVLYRGMGWIVTVTLAVHLILWLGCRKGHDAFLQDVLLEEEERQLQEGDAATSTNEVGNSTVVDSDVVVDGQEMDEEEGER